MSFLLEKKHNLLLKFNLRHRNFATYKLKFYVKGRKPRVREHHDLEKKSRLAKIKSVILHPENCVKINSL